MQYSGHFICSMSALSVLFFFTNEQNVLIVVLFYYKGMSEKVTMQITQLSFFFVAKRTYPVKCSASRKQLRLSFDASSSFRFIGREPTTWPANNCLQIMVCSCVVLSKCDLLQIIFCPCVVVTTLSVKKMAGRFGWAVREWFKYKNKLGDRMIKQLSNSVIAKYCDLSMSRRSIICLSLRLWQIIDLLVTDKSQYFAQPRPIIVN